MPYYKPEKKTRKLEEGIEEILGEAINNCLLCFGNWDLPSLYKNLKLYRRILSLIINKKRYDELKEEFDDLEKLKRKIEENNKITEKEKIQFFDKADKVFTEFSEALKDEDFIFSKKESYGEGAEDEEVIEEE